MSDEVKPTPEDEADDSKNIEVEEVIEAVEVAAPEETASEDAASEDAASEDAASEDAAPEETASKETASKEDASAETETKEVTAEAASVSKAEESKAEDSEEKASEEKAVEEEPSKQDDAPAASAEKPAEESTLSTTMVPPEYVPAVRRGRNRRINIDINLNDVHYKNIPLLTRFLDPFGRILSRRKTKVSAKVQRRAVTAIKQARHLSLLPYTGDHTRLTRRKRR